MPLRILRRLKAVQDAEQIADYIARDSLEAAVRFLDNVDATIHGLAQSPGLGSSFESDHAELTNLRFRKVKGFPNHVIFYIVQPGSIEVVRILHGARDLDSVLKQS